MPSMDIPSARRSRQLAMPRGRCAALESTAAMTNYDLGAVHGRLIPGPAWCGPAAEAA
jgi:hypothetical protein